jgi:hypothetical protein
LIPLSVGTATDSMFGAIALATAGGTVAGTIGALFVVPLLLVGRRVSKRKPRVKKAKKPKPGGPATPDALPVT